MRVWYLSAPLVLFQCVLGVPSSKRGLLYVPSADHPDDDRIWTQPGSDLTWYYNYVADPSAVFKNSTWQFVPMLWGATDGDSDTSFFDSVRAQIDGGAEVPFVLGFNEPDGDQSTGGSNVPADLAAQTWQREIEPLKQQDVKLGAPAVTGSSRGFEWLEAFFKECDGGCTVDFIPVHWYGNFEGLASHIGQVRGTYPNKTIWVTEYALPDASLEESQSFYNMSAEYFDRLDYVTHYSYFGAFRSDVSNIGPKAAMLTQDGYVTGEKH
ncbi:MAG: hypothetical protein M1825_005586 [Sarcosagium campestre]|nr:MAG: hypothetical protein M1825_005586 [Sarcosagium campestre]